MTKVSVCMITHNHEKFIKQAIESVLMQKTDFDYELVIGEDFSTDKTRKIVLKCQKKYPNKIKLILNKKNLGIIPNFIQTLKKCKYKYIALLDGDDYWTSPNKLQKQVNFLENNTDFVICFHNARTLDQETGDCSKLFFYGIQKKVWGLDDLLRNNFIPTLTCVFKNHLFDKFPEWYYHAFPNDWPLHIINAQYGKIGYIDKIMATYRNHGKGAVTGSNPINNYKRYIKTFESIKSYISPKYKPIVNETISKFYFELSIFYNKEKRFNQAKMTIIKCIKNSPFNSRIPKYYLLKFITQLSINIIRQKVNLCYDKNLY